MYYIVMSNVEPKSKDIIKKLTITRMNSEFLQASSPYNRENDIKLQQIQKLLVTIFVLLLFYLTDFLPSQTF